ncbi:MAG: alpha/beta fold hydrolase [Actinophytocola sp.]|uniref:alpha/beta fold hydrolase n=1 Tax=Actinophytocola sp. TaxID=1872138 RepID=UPI0013231E38|nr:alpha/beta hydrolase [Actinophytocola sp.]MPZ82925.1 alpha/beta fold hydrolase [Actinophytocola sp.]
MSDPVVLLHAFPLDSRMWDGLRSATGDRIITPDLPGFGAAPPVGGPDLGLAAAALLDDLDRLGVERAVLGGCSMGGYVAMAVLRAAPSRVSGLVLVDTKATADTEAARENRVAVAARAEAEGIGWLADSMLTNLLGATTLEKRPDVEVTLRALIADQDPAAVAWAQRAMAARPDSLDLLRASGVPALVVRGAEDALIPRQEAVLMADALEVELVEIAGAGHLAPLETPDEVASAVARWLAGPMP